MGHKLCKTTISLSLIFFVFHLCAMACQAHTLFACDPSNDMTRSFPFCKVSLRTRHRVKDLIGRLKLQEKVKLLVNNASSIDRLGIKAYNWDSEGLHGISNWSLTPPRFGGEFPGATNFPQVITTASSFNASLWEAIGQAISTEARAFYNGGRAGLSYWTPNVNIFRDPRWGRGQETPGEDPLVVARYAVRHVSGLQGKGVGDKLKVAAGCKHFTAYDLESWNGTDRYHFNAKVSKQDLEETYNVPFKACVLEGKVASVMCSYNQVNGKPACADPSLLRDTIRGQWHLNGYIVSDCYAIYILYELQNYTHTAEEAISESIDAGLDLECGPLLLGYAEAAIRRGKLKESHIDRALANVFTVQMRLGLFDGPRQSYLSLGPKSVCTLAHQNLALEAAQQGIVLLKNHNRTLPLSNERHKTIAVIGPNSNVTIAMLGDYFGPPCAYTTPLQGISKYANTIHQSGCAYVNCTDNQQFGAAEAAANRANATVLVMGLDQSIESDTLDRSEIILPGRQEELISRVAKASNGPVVLVLMCGGPIDVKFAKDDQRVGAILWVGYPGQAGGAAIADVLFGTINPGGRLPMTWYPQNYVINVPMTDMAMHSDPTRDYPGRTYRFYKGPVVFPFGHGLSYTSFREVLANGPTMIRVPFKGPKSFNNTNKFINSVKVSQIKCETFSIRLKIEVQNIGKADGTHTVMVFATTPLVGESTSEKRLIAFEKIQLAVGAKRRITTNINVCDHLSIVDQLGIRKIPIGHHTLHIGEVKHRLNIQILIKR